MYVVDVDTHREVLDIHADGVRDLAWSPDGRWIAASGNPAHVYDARTGRPRFVTTGHTSCVNTVDWSPDSRLLATGSEDGTARVFAVEAGALQEVARLAAQDLRNGVRSVAFSPDGGQLMTSDWLITSVKVWDVRDQAAAEIANLPGDAGTDSGAALAPDGRSVWVPEGDGRVARYDVATGERLQRLPRPPIGASDFQRLALSPDGRLLAAPGWELPFPVWDTQTGEVAFVVGEGLTGLRLGGRLGRSGRAPRGLGHPRRERSSPARGCSSSAAPAHEVGTISGEPGMEIRSLSFRGDGDVVATTAMAARDDPAARGIRLWDWRHDRLIDRIDGNAVGVAFDPAGDMLITTRLIDNVVDVWDAHTGERVSSLEGHTGVVTRRGVRCHRRAGGHREYGRQRPDLGSAHRTAAVGAAARGSLWAPRAWRSAPTAGASSRTWADGITRIWTLDLDDLVDIARDRVTRGLTSVECERYLHVDTCPEA